MLSQGMMGLQKCPSINLEFAAVNPVAFVCYQLELAVLGLRNRLFKQKTLAFVSSQIPGFGICLHKEVKQELCLG